MDQYKELVNSHKTSSPRKADMKKDKLAETKRAERDLKDRLKAVQRAAKDKKRETAQLEAQKYRDHRVVNGSQTKRASKDAREASRREAQKQGETCEHGIWKCQICYPQPRTGKINHQREAQSPVLIY